MNEKVEAFKDKTNFPSDEFLHINSCGVTNDTAFTRIYRPKGRVDHLIFLVLKGSVSAVVDGSPTLIKEGEALIFLKDEPQDYTYLPSPSSETCWVHFCGTAADEVLRAAQIERSGKLLPVSPAETERLFRAIVKYRLLEDSLSATAYLLRLISSVSTLRKKQETAVERLIRKEAENIAVNFFKEIDLNEAAARCHLSRTRFNHLFTKIVGTSPKKMQTELRMERARELLAFSDLSISEISEQCGYIDPLYFSRLFSKASSISPVQFRKEQWSKSRG